MLAMPDVVKIIFQVVVSVVLQSETRNAMHTTKIETANDLVNTSNS
jgi:hypothetical protein